MLMICQNPIMVFHESFWLATSAAAPVIALAVAVALPDVGTAFEDATVRRQTAELVASVYEVEASPWGLGDKVISRVISNFRQVVYNEGSETSSYETDESMASHELFVARKFYRRALANWSAALASIGIQAGLLGFSLSALAYDRDLLPLWLAIASAVGGILLLTGILALSNRFQRSWRINPRPIYKNLNERIRRQLEYTAEKEHERVQEEIRERLEGG
jgi:hypothetical protein